MSSWIRRYKVLSDTVVKRISPVIRFYQDNSILLCHCVFIVVYASTLRTQSDPEYRIDTKNNFVFHFRDKKHSTGSINILNKLVSI